MFDITRFCGSENLFPISKLKETFLYNRSETLDIEGKAIFDLYFLSHLGQIREKTRDNVKIGIYHNNKEIDSKNITLEPKLFYGKIQK